VSIWVCVTACSPPVHYPIVISDIEYEPVSVKVHRERGNAIVVFFSKLLEELELVV
jgi:hypothetical protein